MESLDGDALMATDLETRVRFPPPPPFSEESDTLRCAFFALVDTRTRKRGTQSRDIIGKTMHGLECGTARSSFIFSGVLFDVPRL